MRLARIKMIVGTLSIAAVMALASPNLALGQRGGDEGGHGEGHGGEGGSADSGGRGGGGGGEGDQFRGGGQISDGAHEGAFQAPQAIIGRGALYANPPNVDGGDARPDRGSVNVQPSGHGGQYYSGRGGQYYGGSNNWNGSRYPYGNRYSSGYRGFYGSPGISIGIGSAFGPYGYGAFPWYNGAGFYGGGVGMGAAYRGYGYNDDGYNNYRGAYYRGGRTVRLESQQAPQQLPPEQDYVPQLNNTTVELAAAASGGAVLGVTLDPQYPNAAVVREIVLGSPAQRAGLRPGDMITSIDEKQVQSFNDVVTLIGSMQPGATVALQFVRPILRSEVQAAAPEQQLSTTAAVPPAAPSPPPLPAPQINQ